MSEMTRWSKRWLELVVTRGWVLERSSIDPEYEIAYEVKVVLSPDDLLIQQTE